MMRLSLIKFDTIMIIKVVMGRADFPRSVSEPNVVLSPLFYKNSEEPIPAPSYIWNNKVSCDNFVPIWFFF